MGWFSATPAGPTEIPRESRVDRIAVALERIADALDRAVPMPPDRTTRAPIGSKDVKVVSDEMRRRAQVEKAAETDLGYKPSRDPV